MATYSVEIVNLAQIISAFNKAPELTVQEVDKAIQQSAFAIEADSKANTPVRTGYLRASHTTTFSPLQGVIQPTASYAVYVHEGTYKMTARPFLAEAVDSNEDRVNDFFTQAMQRVFDQIAEDSG